MAIRQAVAQIIDRDAIAENAYDGTVAPLYSIVPPGFGGQKDSFKEKYGEPDVDAAKQILRRRRHQDAGRPHARLHARPTTARTPWTRPTSSQRQLEASGLFDVTTEEHRVGAVPDDLQGGRLRPVHPRLVPRLPGRRQLPVAVHRDGGFFANDYSNDEVNKLLDQELGETDAGRARRADFGQLQDIVGRGRPAHPVVGRPERRRGYGVG